MRRRATSGTAVPTVGRRTLLKRALGLASLGALGVSQKPRAARRRRAQAPDYVVVGGGIYGTGLGWELSRRGARVLVLEADRIASGASGGIGRRGVRSNGRDARQLPLMKLAQERWPEWARALGDARIFRRIGHLHLIESETDLPAAEAQVRLQESYAVRSELLDRDALRRLEPHLSEGVLAAMYCPNDGASSHAVTTRALARAARRHGARIRHGVNVVGLEHDVGRVTAVRTVRGERIAVGHEIVLAANAGTAKLVSSGLGIALPLFKVLPQVLVTAPTDPVPVRHVIGHVRRRLAAKPLPGARVMITGGWLGRVDAATGRGSIVDSEVAGNLAEAVAVYPSLAGVRVARAFADRFEALSSDLLPIIDRLPGAANVLVAAGWSGQGWAPAPACVELIADWLVEGARPELLAPFGLSRFA